MPPSGSVRSQLSIPMRRIRSEMTRAAVSDPITVASNASASALGALFEGLGSAQAE